MTNLDIIKHLATNDTARLAELLDDIYCLAWNNGSYAHETNCEKFSSTEITDFNEWLKQDAAQSDIYCNYELAEWAKLINKENNHV